MCGGHMFEDADEAKPTSGQATAEKPAEAVPTVDANDLVHLIEKAMLDQKVQARKDFHTLRDYIDRYRARADNLEFQVREWCDELDEAAAGHKKVVATYTKTYHHMEGVQNGILARIHALEVLLATQPTTKGCRKTCRCQNDSVPKWMGRVEARMQALEDECKRKDDKVRSLSARCDALQARVARHESETKEMPSSATAIQSSEVDARWTNLAETVAIYGNYFEEIRDRVLQQEGATKAVRYLVDNLPLSQDLEDHIEQVVARVQRGSVDKGLQEIQQSLDKLAQNLDDKLSEQKLANEERFKLLERADQDLDSQLAEARKETVHVKTAMDSQIVAHREAVDAQIRNVGFELFKTKQPTDSAFAGLESSLSSQMMAYKEAAEAQVKRLHLELLKSKQHTDSAFTSLESSLGGRIAAYKEAAESGTKNVRAGFDEKLVHFAQDLQGRHFGGIAAQLQQQGGQLQGLQDQYKELETCFAQLMAALRQQQTAFGPVLTTAPDFGWTFEPGRDEGEDDMTDNEAEEDDAELSEPEVADGDGPMEEEPESDASMDSASESNSDDSEEESTADALHRTLRQAAAHAAGFPDELAAGAAGAAAEKEKEEEEEEEIIPGLDILSISESSPNPYGLGPTTMTGVGGNPTTDSVLYRPDRRPKPSKISVSVPPYPSTFSIKSPFSGNVSQVPLTSVPSGGAFTKSFFASPPPPSPAARPCQAAQQSGDVAGSSNSSSASHLTTTPLAGPIQQEQRQEQQPPKQHENPPPGPEPADPPSPNTVANRILRGSFHFQPTPEDPVPKFSYSVEYIDKLRTHLVNNVLGSWIQQRFSREMIGSVLELVVSRDRRVGSLRDGVAPRANLAPQNAYYKDAVERLFGVWFDICIVDEVVHDLDEFLLAADFAKEEERARFLEEHVRPYMREHPTDC